MLDFLLPKYKKIHRFINETDRLIERIEEKHIFLMAAGIAFNILLYIIPLFLLAIYVVNNLFEQKIMDDSLKKIITDFMPPVSSATQIVDEIITEVRLINRHSSLFGWIGITVLMWLSSTLLSSLRSGLNRIFNIETPKIFIIYRVRDIFIALVLAVLMLIFSYAIPLSGAAISYVNGFFPEMIGSYVSGITLLGVSLSTSFIFFYLLFRHIPNKKIPRFTRLLSTLLSVGMIEISRNLFGWYLESLSNYGRFYGTYAIIVSFAIWIYYSILIILMSAETAQFFYEKREEKKAAAIEASDEEE